MIDNESIDYKRFPPKREYEGLFRIVGKTLDKLMLTDNVVIRDLAAMDALIYVLNLLSRNVITSFTSAISIQGNDTDDMYYNSR